MTGYKRIQPIANVVAFGIVVTTLVYVVSLVEQISLIASGDVLVRKNPCGPFAGANIVRAAHNGENLDVDGCESTKSDVVIRVRLPGGEIGFVSDGPYVLQRQGLGLGWIIRHPDRAVFSRRGMFENRS